MPLHPETEQVYAVVDGADDSQKEHACKTEHQADAGAAVTAECGDGGVVRVDEHGLHHQQVVVE